jgi:hypothetical protein
LFAKVLHTLTSLLEVEEEHVGIDDCGLLDQTDAFDTVHDLGEGITQVFALDIDDGIKVFVFPVELAANGEDVLIPLVRIGVVDSFGEFVLVNGGIPY